MHEDNRGFDEALQYPLISALFKRRTHRVSKGVKSIPAGSLSYTSTQEPQSLGPLEEAMLIASTGTTGFTMPDRPFQTDTGEHILGSPNIKMMGRSAGSPDNAQATHFFLINDTGTYFLERPEGVDDDLSFTPSNLIARAEKSKRLVMKERFDLPRHFPNYLDSNRFLSNLPGTTILMPIVDTTQQYINGLMYLMTEAEGHRPVIVDDRNFYRSAGLKKWIRNGFLNKNIKIPLSALWTFRADLEAALLLQNAMLVTQAMGLGGWIHATMGPPFMLGHPLYSEQAKGLGFRYETPKLRLIQMLRWGTFLRKPRANPVGLDGVIQGMCPPYYKNMSEAVDALVEMKYGKGGIYNDNAYFRKIYKGDFSEKYQREVPRFTPQTIECVKDICNYIYDTHGRFPAHVDAMYVPGIWLQAHHIDLEYYDYLFNSGYTETQSAHQALWHGAS